MIPVKELKKLTKGFPTESTSEIAKKSGLTESYVRMVLKGQRHNQAVIDAAIEYRKEFEAKKNDTIERIQKATQGEG